MSCCSVEMDRSWDHLHARVFIAKNTVLIWVLPLIRVYIMDFWERGTVISTCLHVDSTSIDLALLAALRRLTHFLPPSGEGGVSYQVVSLGKRTRHGHGAQRPVLI